MKKATLKVITGALKAHTGADGRKRLAGTASSTVIDRSGDRMTEKAVRKMAAEFIGMTVFLNHSYKVPEDVFGQMEGTRLVRRGEFDDLDVDMVVDETNERALKVYQQIESGLQLGISVGVIVEEAKRGKAQHRGQPVLEIDDVTSLEASIVGVPANQRSWARAAKKGLIEAGELDDFEEADLPSVEDALARVEQDYALIKSLPVTAADDTTVVASASTEPEETGARESFAVRTDNAGPITEAAVKAAHEAAIVTEAVPEPEPAVAADLQAMFDRAAAAIRAAEEAGHGADLAALRDQLAALAPLIKADAAPAPAEPVVPDAPEETPESAPPLEEMVARLEAYARALTEPEDTPGTDQIAETADPAPPAESEPGETLTAAAPAPEPGELTPAEPAVETRAAPDAALPMTRKFSDAVLYGGAAQLGDAVRCAAEILERATILPMTEPWHVSEAKSAFERIGAILYRLAGMIPAESAGDGVEETVEYAVRLDAILTAFEGRRNNKADEAHIQAVHDFSLSLGAACPAATADKAAPSEAAATGGDPAPEQVPGAEVAKKVEAVIERVLEVTERTRRERAEAAATEQAYKAVEAQVARLSGIVQSFLNDGVGRKTAHAVNVTGSAPAVRRELSAAAQATYGDLFERFPLPKE